MLDHTTTNYGLLEADTRSHQKKARLTKMKGTLLFKWLAALCVLECVSAAASPPPPSPPSPPPSPTCGCSAEIKHMRSEIADEHSKDNERMRSELTAEYEAKLENKLMPFASL